MTVEVSDLWKSLCTDVFANIDEAFVQTFRNPGGANNRLAAWDPFDKSMRYFRFLLYTAAQRQPERFFELYRKLGKVDLGGPVAVTLHSCEINIDYFLSVDEFLFLESAVDLGAIRSVVEIGAGFGRTCHALLALCAGGPLERYYIVDLPPVLELSRRVLAQVVPEHYHKIRFIEAADEGSWEGLTADLAINIDSFQEMMPTTIDFYMRRLISRARFCYIKNPIGKYDPMSIGLPSIDSHKVQDVFSLGYCRDVVDVFNDVALADARPRFLGAYRPASNWRVIADRPMNLFPYYHHALYSQQ
jgi:putative sugar O-methyltransferase